MRTKFLFSFLFLFLMLSCVAVVSASPSQISTPSPIAIPPLSSAYYDYSNIFEDYSYMWFNFTIGDTPFADGYNTNDNSCYTIDGNVKICFAPFSDRLVIQNLGTTYRTMDLTVGVSSDADGSDYISATIPNIILGQYGGPVQTASISNLQLGISGTATLNLEDFFYNFDEVCYHNILDGEDGGSNCITGGYIDVAYTNNRVEFEITRNPVDGKYDLDFTAHGNDSELEFGLEVKNSKGSKYADFLVTTSSTTNYSSPYPGGSQTEGAPYQIASMTPPSVEKGQVYEISANQFFQNYSFISVGIEDSVLQQSIFTSQVSKIGPSTCGSLNTGGVGKELKVCLTPSSGLDDVLIRFVGQGYDSSIPVFITASNQYGQITISTIVNSFSEDYTGGASPGGTTSPTAISGSSSFIGYLVSIFDDIFPNKDSLIPKYRYGFVFLTLLLVNCLVLFGLYGAKGLHFAPYILAVLNIAGIFYFTAIGYIPLGFLIISALVGIGLLVLKVKGGS